MSGIFSGSGSVGITGGHGRVTSRGMGLFDDFFNDISAEAGDTSTVKDTPMITGTAGPAATHSPGAMPKFGSCLKPYIDDPKNPSAFCILDPKINYACPPNQIYDPVKLGCVPYKPDLIEGAQPQTGVICPYGTKAVGQACVSLVGGGAATGGGVKPGPGTGPAQIVPDGTNALTGEGGIPTWAYVLGGVGLVAIVGGAIAAKKSAGSSSARSRRR